MRPFEHLVRLGVPLLIVVLYRLALAKADQSRAMEAVLGLSHGDPATSGALAAAAVGLRFLRHTIGSGRQALDAISPARQADKVGIPVLLAAGARDFRAAPEHTEAMRDALAKAGNPPEETIIQSGEMHGFYDEKNREALYAKILSFLQRNVGGHVDVGTPETAR